MREIKQIAAVVVLMLGCETQQGAEPLGQVELRMQNMKPDEAYAYLERTAQSGETVGDLVTAEVKTGYAIQAESIVVGIRPRGTDRIAPKLRPHLVKLLVKAYNSIGVAEEIIASKDAAPVRCVAELPPFASRGEKIDLKITSYDPTVNLEGGTLVDTPMVRYISLPADQRHPGFTTPSGLVPAGTQGYARGDVTLNPGYREGVQLGAEVPSVGYVPAGVLTDKTWGCTLVLKKPDENTALLVHAAIRRRFGQVESRADKMLVIISMPNRYQGHWRRYLDVVMRIRVRPPAREARLADYRRLAQALGSADPKQRYDAECCLEAVGREASGALLEACRSASALERQSAMRVLAFVTDKRAVGPLTAESRQAKGAFRAESAFLMSILGGDEVVQRLTEMLSDDDPMARYQALVALDKLGAKEAPVKTYYSPGQRNFAMHLVDVPGKKFVVIKSLNGIRRIALFGSGIRVKPDFRGSVGPISLSVGADSTQIRHKRQPGDEPMEVRTVELQNLVSRLDRLGVSINDIIGLIALMDKKGALAADLYWTE